MIFSLNGNLFGPNTQYFPGDITRTALEVFQRTGFKTAVQVHEITTETVRLRCGTELRLDAITKTPLILVLDSGFAIRQLLETQPQLSESLLTLDQIAITDHFSGRQLRPIPSIATNFPILMADRYGSDVFSTEGFIFNDQVAATDDSIFSLGSELFLKIEDAVYRSPSQPLYKNGRLLRNTAEPFGSWPSVEKFSEQSLLQIDEPVLYLSHPYSVNYNIFFHETILCSLEWHRLPKNTRVLVRGDAYRIDALVRLGIPEEKILCASETSMLLRNVIIPIRRLNLKYIDTPLIELYRRLSDSLEAEAPTQQSNRTIYINRKSITRNSGANRFIINDQEVTEALNRKAVDNIYLEDFSLIEKFKALSGVDTIVTPIGANLVNVCMARDIRRIILICSPVWGHFLHYWVSLLKLIHPKTEIIIFDSCSIEDNNQSNDPFNKPFRVRADELSRII